VSTLPAAILLVILVWWIGTGIVLRLQQQLNPAKRTTSIGICMVASLSLGTLLLTSSALSGVGIFSAFVSAVILWGCVELSYYLGKIAGTHTMPCPPQTPLWSRFKLALGTSIWHELLVLGLGFILIVLLYNATNAVGLYTYMVLWLMRWSAKLNLFFGVPNFNTSWIPERLAYISTYIKTGTITPFFFITIVCASTVVYQLLAKSNNVSLEYSLIFMMPAVLLILAILEHLFMLVPFQDLKMWNRVFNSKS